MNRALALVHGNRLVQDGPLSVPVVASGPVGMPEGLADVEQAVWKRLAPLAEVEGTLTAARVPAFAWFCGLVVLERQQAEEPTLRGRSIHQGTMRMVDALYARFRLTGDGKATVAVSKPVELTPLQKLQAQSKQRRGAK